MSADLPVNPCTACPGRRERMTEPIRVTWLPPSSHSCPWPLPLSGPARAAPADRGNRPHGTPAGKRQQIAAKNYTPAVSRLHGERLALLWPERAADPDPPH